MCYMQEQQWSAMKLSLSLTIVLLLLKSSVCCQVRERCMAPAATRPATELFGTERDALAYAKCHIACVNKVSFIL